MQSKPVQAFLRTFIAILFFLSLGGPFVFFGFQTIRVHGEKDDSGSATIEAVHEHFGGLLKFRRQMDAVNEVSYFEVESSDGGLTMGLEIKGAKGKTTIMDASNVDTQLKQQMHQALKGFLSNPDQLQLDAVYHMNNIFGWVGLPIFLLGLIGLVSWPFSKPLSDEEFAARKAKGEQSLQRFVERFKK